MTSTDEDLMGAVRDGDITKLSLLFERHRGRAFALCYRMTGDRTVADDLVQESFLRVLRYRASFEGRARFTTWLFRLVRNVCLDHLAGSERARALSSRVAAEPTATTESPDPDDLLALRQALGRLRSEAREILILRRFHDLSYREIGEIVGVSEGAARVRAHRALADLRQLVHTEQGG